MEVTEETIMEATGLDLDGMNFYRERKVLDKAIDDFVKTKHERNCLVKIGNSYFNPTSVSVAVCVLHYYGIFDFGW